MRSGARIAEVGKQLLAIAREVTADVNDRYLLAHDAMQSLLRQHAQLTQADRHDLEVAISTAAIAHGFKTTAE